MAKYKRRKKIPAILTGDASTPERQRRNGGIAREVIARDNHGEAMMFRFKAAIDCALDAYFQRGVLTQTEYMAGMKFRHAYLRAVLKVRVEDIDSGSHGDPEMAFLTPIYSERILREAYSVLSASQKALIIAVCGHDEWAGGFYKLQTLHRGLEKMIDLWRLA
ncbi:MAG: hypothetical protein WDO70_04950 [Alphaproteobacteria bacterium]